MDDINSFNAIRDFLDSKELYRGGFATVQIMVESEKGRHFMKDTVEFVFNETYAYYTLYSKCFYSYLKTDKLKSSEQIFLWDEKEKKLFVQLKNIKIEITKT